MLEIRTATESDSSLYAKLFQKNYENLDGNIVDPKIVINNNRLYVVDELAPFYSIVSDEDDVLVTMDEDEISSIIELTDIYKIRTNGEIPIVSKESLIDDKIEQLFIKYPSENQPRPYLHHYQGIKDETVVVEQCYDLFNYINALESYFNYIDNKKADIINLKYYIRFLKYFRKHINNTFVLEPSSNAYFKTLFKIQGNYGIVPILGSTSVEELKYIVDAINFNYNVDKKMADMLLGIDERVKALKQNIKLYNENTNLD